MKAVVVCEDAPDFEVVRLLVEKVFHENNEYRTFVWMGVRPGDGFFKWSSLKGLEKELGIRIPVHGSFGGESGELYSKAARKALYILSKRTRPDAALLVVDSDGVNRLPGLEQARSKSKHTWEFTVAIGQAHPKREAWLLCCFDPADEREAKEHTKLVQRLSFDPLREPHRANSREGERNIKKILASLTGGDRNREALCLQSHTVSSLKLRSGETGLKEFLEDIQANLLPCNH